MQYIFSITFAILFYPYLFIILLYSGVFSVVGCIITYRPYGLQVMIQPTTEKTMWFPNGFYTNQAVQQARSFRFRISEEEEVYYPCSENKGADQLRDLRLCFRICRLLVFSCGGSYTVHIAVLFPIYRPTAVWDLY